MSKTMATLIALAGIALLSLAASTALGIIDGAPAFAGRVFGPSGAALPFFIFLMWRLGLIRRTKREREEWPRL